MTTEDTYREMQTPDLIELREALIGDMNPGAPWKQRSFIRDRLEIIDRILVGRKGKN